MALSLRLTPLALSALFLAANPATAQTARPAQPAAATPAATAVPVDRSP